MASASALQNTVGICIHLGNQSTPYFTNFAAVAPLLKDLGIYRLRDDAVYAEGIDGNYFLYANIRAMAAQGFTFDLVCADPLNGNIYTPPSRLADIYSWCNGGVHCFEGSNEPNLAAKAWINPSISAEHQKALYAAVKATPAMNGFLVPSPSYIMGNVPLAENLSACVDYINIHPYAGMEHPETTGPGQLSGFIAGAQRWAGAKPVFVSEIGYHTAVQTSSGFLPVSEAIKTRYLPRTLLWAFLTGAAKTYLYQLIDSSNNGLTDPESNFGLVDFSGNRKPSFFAVKQFLALLQTPKPPAPGPTWGFTLTGDATDLQTVMLGRPDGSAVLFVWLGVAGWNAGTRTALAPVTRPSVLAITGGTPNTVVGHLFNDDGTQTVAPLAPCSGEYALNISDQLTAVEIS